MKLTGLGLIIMVALTTAVKIKESSPSLQKIRYDNYRVYKVSSQNTTVLPTLVQLLQNQKFKFDIWKQYNAVDKDIHIMVSPKEAQRFMKFLKKFNLDVEVLIPDVQKHIEAEQPPIYRSANATFGWTRYYKLPEIEAWLDDILTTYPQVTAGFNIGQSYEGRNIRGIKISYKSGNPGIFIESNIHAREWITSATATWFINELLTSKDPEIRNLAESHDWYIVPVFNVDGFEYTHKTNRMWRKTRQPVTNSPCIGTDANRNFDTQWMVNGASDDPCSETYAGNKPFSEPETRALADFLTAIKDKINIYLAFHSYSQLLLSPYGHSDTEFPANYNDMLTIGQAFSEAISSLSYGTEYTYGSFGKAMYVGSGTSVDYAYSELNIKLAYTIEYRDKGRYGFILPPVQILPNCEELMAGMKALVKKSRDLGYLK